MTMKTSPFLLALAPSTLLLLAACGGGGSSASSPPPPPEVEVMTVQTESFPVYREVVATLEGAIDTKVRPRVQGYLDEQVYENGTFVEKGDILFRIDQAPYEIDLQRAEADLARARAELTRNEINVQRDEELIKGDAISQRQLDNSRQALAAARANVKAAETEVEQAELNLSYTTVRARIDGLVGEAEAQVGDLVGASDTLAEISRIDEVKARFSIPDRYYLERAAEIRKALAEPANQRPANVELILSDGTTYPQKGRINAVDRAVNAGTGSLSVFALFPNPDDLLRPGQFARVRVLARTIDKAILIPQRAFHEVQGSYQVYVVKSDGTISVTDVVLGVTDGPRVVVRSGLRAGETIVVEGWQKASAGKKVRTKPWQPPASYPSGSGSSGASSGNSSSAS